MSNIFFLTKDEYYAAAKRLSGGHWTPDTIDTRWDYHLRAVGLIRALKINNASDVLEMGTMGVCCVKGSETMDYAERWDFPGKQPTYLHDARILPWPFADNRYELFMALRVFQHLVPYQKECTQEAMRIAKKVILVAPAQYINPVLPNSTGITYSDFVSYLDGVHPNLYLPTAQGFMYYWDTENPSQLSLEDVMHQAPLVNVQAVTLRSELGRVQRFLGRKMRKLEKALKVKHNYEQAPEIVTEQER